MLGAAINSGTYDRPVTVKVHVGVDKIEPFGRFNQALDGNVNDDGNPRTELIDAVYDPGEVITITGRSWKLKPGRSGSNNGDWKVHYERNSYDQSPYVRVLRDGDPVPDVPGFMDQRQSQDQAGHRLLDG